MEPDSDLRPLIGGRTATTLAKALELHTLDDALRHFPRRYLKRGELTDLADLRVGDDVTVMAEVASVRSRRTGGRGGRKPVWMTEVVLTDGREKLMVTFFNQKWRDATLIPGRQALFAGKVGSYRGTRQLVHPDHLDLADPNAEAEQYVGRLMPVYPTSGNLRVWRIAQAIALLLPLAGDLPDAIPEGVRSAHGLLGFADALQAIHRPESMADVEAARHRFRFEEAFVLQALLLRRRAQRQSATAIPRAAADAGLVHALDSRLPFALTAGQQQAAAEIAADMAQAHPMLRLLQGDVGSGKTVVALRAMLATVDAGAQAALVAPTEVLAQQHYQTISAMLGPLGRRGQIDGDPGGTSVVLLTGSLGAAERRQALLDIASGEAGIVVGTHALFSESVMFADLGLVVVDEQHRFGVEQRAALVEAAGESAVPHQLVMTATPIPRSVAMTVFGDLDVTTLRERPAGRHDVATHVVPVAQRPDYLQRAWTRIVEEVAAGRKAYVVCPRISEASGGDDALGPDEPDPVTQADDSLDVAQSGDDDISRAKGTRPPGYPPTAVTELHEHLRTGPLAGLRLGVMHGRLDTVGKERVMTAFAAPSDDPGAVDVLVSTTVIEVGVDVPDAAVMVIIDAHRFGISSLHQLRGRVGRGGHPGLCLLVTDVTPDDPGGARLAAVAATTDGFELSLADLRLRREGNVLGAAQSGRANSLRLLSVLDDEEIIVAARAAAEDILREDSELADYPQLRDQLERIERRMQADFLEKA